MKRNIQFAVVREDYLVESNLVQLFDLKKILLIASGGCTALNLQALYPELEISLFDTNPHQLRLVQNKIQCLQSNNIEQIKKQFNIADDNPEGLNACGNFESLFRCFRDFVRGFILNEAQLKHLLAQNDEAAELYLTQLTSNPYWYVAFQIFFSDSLLVTMFGPDAIQYANPGSYPEYFRLKIENGLRKTNRTTNYFLQHIFLGYYLNNANALPPCYKKSFIIKPIKMYESKLNEIENLSDYDMISLSNIFDWSNPIQIEECFSILAKNLKPGAIVLYRQLNNANDYKDLYIENFVAKHKLGEDLLKSDRSLFYENIVVLEKAGT